MACNWMECGQGTGTWVFKRQQIREGRKWDSQVGWNWGNGKKFATLRNILQQNTKLLQEPLW